MADVPLLEEEALLQVPPLKLASEAVAIRLIWGQVNSDFNGFRGVKDLCCQVKVNDRKERRGICNILGGCMEKGSPCLLLKIKERWIEAGLPIIDNDYKIIEKVAKLNAEFTKKRRYTKLTVIKKEEYVNKLKTTTLNLAPSNYKVRIKADQILSAAQNFDKITLLEDYIGPTATR